MPRTRVQADWDLHELARPLSDEHAAGRLGCAVHSGGTLTVCEHKQFLASVNVNRLEDCGRFMAGVRVQCEECGQPFSFVGLPCGLNLDGATVSVDGMEAHLAIAPHGEAARPIEGVRGFSIAMHRRESSEGR